MKEFIEMPFGAKDSELCKWEYTIPEGFVASIENGKIVVKKEESEDEKIRKEIIEYLRFKYEDSNAIRHDYEKWIAWLEKQGGQKPINYADEEIVEAVKDTSVLDMVEPNPAWSEEDEYVYNEILKRVADKKLYEHDLEYIYKWLKSLKPQPQWKPSEEQIQALEYQVNSTYIGSWQYKASKELLEQLKKL